jgi:hypothetical protein
MCTDIRVEGAGHVPLPASLIRQGVVEKGVAATDGEYSHTT